jgi:hypothetical protein
MNQSKPTVALQSALWKYKAVFFLGKSELGLTSDVVPATAKP